LHDVFRGCEKVIAWVPNPRINCKVDFCTSSNSISPINSRSISPYFDPATSRFLLYPISFLPSTLDFPLLLVIQRWVKYYQNQRRQSILNQVEMIGESLPNSHSFQSRGERVVQSSFIELKDYRLSLLGNTSWDSTDTPSVM